MISYLLAGPAVEPLALAEARAWLRLDTEAEDALVTTLAMERDVNTFFRLDSPSVIARLQEEFRDIGDSPSPKDVFLKLRELRNSW